jgi:CMP-N-acetylneuraminic acid synthetase
MMAGTVFHCLKELKTKEGYVPDRLILLQPSSPLRTARHIDEAFLLLKHKDCDSVISVTKPAFHPLKAFKINKRGFLEGAISSRHCFIPRQQLPEAYAGNGAIHLIKTKAFIKGGSFLTFQTRPYIMPFQESADIDNIADFEYVSYLIAGKRKRRR